MLQLLLGIYKEPRSKYIAFKWWTMLYFFHHLDRFSTDLDFDIIDPWKKDEIIEYIKNILRKFWEIKNETTWSKLHRLIYRYGGSDHNIKIECSTQKSKYDSYEYQSLLWQQVLCMTKESSFANKLCALASRIANRDMYDIRRMEQQHRHFTTAIIEEKMNRNISNFFVLLQLHIIQNFKNNTILWQSWLVLSENQRQEVKKNLIQEVLDIIAIRKESYN